MNVVEAFAPKPTDALETPGVRAMHTIARGDVVDVYFKGARRPVTVIARARQFEDGSFLAIMFNQKNRSFKLDTITSESVASRRIRFLAEANKVSDVWIKQRAQRMEQLGHDGSLTNAAFELKILMDAQLLATNDEDNAKLPPQAISIAAE